MEPIYRRVLIKLSGEALEGSQESGIHPETLEAVASELAEVSRLGVQLALVLGGGNIFRGLAGSASGMDRPTADAMGMLATVINCLAVEDALRRQGVSACTFSALPVGAAARPFSRRDALKCLDRGEVVVLGAGTGNPYFTTDSAAALRALELDTDALFKGTKVDGIYDKDPKQHDDARRFSRLSYNEILERKLGVMDLTAVTLCRENDMPLQVFNMQVPGNIKRVMVGEDVGTKVVQQGEPE